MFFKGKLDEYLFVSEIVPERKYMFNTDLKKGLTILWNTGAKFNLTIDNIPYEINTNCFVFLTAFHKIADFDFEKLRVIQFNQPFYCIENHDSDVGCKGLLFFGASSVPKIEVKDNIYAFNLIWEVLEMEIDQHDSYTLEMLKAILKRVLILCVRIYKKQNFTLKEDSKAIGLIREFNFLVEKHYKTHTTVAAYADMLFKTSKTLANIFKKHIDKTPLEIINNRRLLEAKRLLNYTDFHIQEIANELSFNDVQSFSSFFKKQTNMSPTEFRNNTKGV